MRRSPAPVVSTGLATGSHANASILPWLNETAPSPASVTITVSATWASLLPASSIVDLPVSRSASRWLTNSSASPFERDRRSPCVRPSVVVAARREAERVIRHDEQLIEARCHCSGGVGEHVRSQCPSAGIDGHHRPVAAEGQDHRGRRARSGPRPDPGDALVRQRAPDEIAGHILAQRSCDGGRGPSRAAPTAVIAPPPGVRRSSAAKRSSPSPGSDSRPTNVRSRNTVWRR